jgi:hypothetical protein
MPAWNPDLPNRSDGADGRPLDGERPVDTEGSSSPPNRKTLDAAREWGGLVVVGSAVAALVAVVLIATATLSQFVFVAVVIVLAAFVAIGLGAAKLLGAQRVKLANRYRRIRERTAELAAVNGWRYSAAGEVPRAVLPLVFSSSFSSLTQFGTRMGITAESASEVVDGTYRARQFSALHLDGYVATGNGGIKRGNSRSENIVLLRLPQSLPAFRLLNAAGSDRWDYGTPLPAVTAIPSSSPTSTATLSSSSTSSTAAVRWRFQSANPAFSADLLEPQVIALLGSIPALDCSIACTDGYLVAYRDPDGSPESVLGRLELLSLIADTIPPVCFQRAG